MQRSNYENCHIRGVTEQEIHVDKYTYQLRETSFFGSPGGLKILEEQTAIPLFVRRGKFSIHATLDDGSKYGWSTLAMAWTSVPSDRP